MANNQTLFALTGIGLITASVIAARKFFEAFVSTAEARESAQGVGGLVLGEARASVGITEKSRNGGPEVDAFLARVGLPTGQNWCAAAAWTWTDRAFAKLGRPNPIAPTAGAKALMGQFVKRGLFIAKKDATPASVPPGSLVFWDRSHPPGSSWQGHVGIVAKLDGRKISTVEGNSGPQGDRVSDSMNRSLDDSALLGFGVWPS